MGLPCFRVPRCALRFALDVQQRSPTHTTGRRKSNLTLVGCEHVLGLLTSISGWMAVFEILQIREEILNGRGGSHLWTPLHLAGHACHVNVASVSDVMGAACNFRRRDVMSAVSALRGSSSNRGAILRSGIYRACARWAPSPVTQL